MECEKVRDRFSSLLEGELDPLEEKIIREHLASCSECQKEFEGFGKTVNWLHAVEEMGELLGLPEGTIKSRLHRARMDLKGILKRFAY